MKSLIKYIALFSFIVLSKLGFSTAQYGDILIVDKDTSWINSNPLPDTIRTIILKEIDLEERTSLPDSGGCFLVVQFDEKGFIDSMSIGITPSTEDLNTLELLVLSNAQKALKDFPPLMLVSHPNYRPVRIELFFGVHCLKNRYDRAYGCRYE